MVDTVALTQEDLTKLQENFIDSLKDEIGTVDIHYLELPREQRKSLR